MFPSPHSARGFSSAWASVPTLRSVYFVPSALRSSTIDWICLTMSLFGPLRLATGISSFERVGAAEIFFVAGSTTSSRSPTFAA